MAPRRKQQKKNKNNRSRQAVTRSMPTYGPPNPKPKSPRQPRNRAQRGLMTKLSPAGRAFLKCAFASPDFSVDPGQGIPDGFNGKVIGIKDSLTVSLPLQGGNSGGTDYYILVPPIPGYAYFMGSFQAGYAPNGDFTGRTYDTYDTNYGNSSDAGSAMKRFNYSKFRYASSAVGVYCTTNDMSWGGSISVWKADLSLETVLQPLTYTDGTTYTQYNAGEITVVGGLASISNIAPKDSVTFAFKEGAYAYGLDRSSGFQWNSYTIGPTQYADNTNNGATNVRRLLSADNNRPLTGLGNSETIVIKISVPQGVTNSCVLKTWACLENQPIVTSALYQFAHISPPCDPVALSIYSRIKNELPVAVVARENAHFWERFCNLVDRASHLVSFIPGPIGQFAAGLNALNAYWR